MVSMATPSVSLNSGPDPLDALTAIIVGAAWADGFVLPCEADRLEHTLSALPVFRGQSAEALRAMVERVTKKAADGDAMTLISEAGAALPAQLRGTAFAIAVDVLLVDGRLRGSELRFIEELRRLLKVRRSFADRVVGVLRTKNLVFQPAWRTA